MGVNLMEIGITISPDTPSLRNCGEILRKEIVKLILETKHLPIALLRITMVPSKEVGLSPSELLFGLSYLSKASYLPMMEN